MQIDERSKTSPLPSKFQLFQRIKPQIVVLPLTEGKTSSYISYYLDLYRLQCRNWRPPNPQPGGAPHKKGAP